MTSEEQHRKDCLRRYYENMDIAKAKNLLSKYRAESRKKAQVFIKRINTAKGYKAL